MAVGNLGYSTGVVPGLFIERFGSFKTAAVGLILGTASNYLVAYCITQAVWFANNFWALIVGVLLLG